MVKYKITRDKEGRIKNLKEINRREFLKNSVLSCLSVGLSGLYLSTINEEDKKPQPFTEFVEIIGKNNDNKDLYENNPELKETWDSLHPSEKEEKKVLDYPTINNSSKIKDKLLENDVERNYNALKQEKYTSSLSNAFSELSQYQDYIQEGVDNTGLDINLAYAIFGGAESRGNRKAKSKDGAIGLAQFMETAAREMGLRVDNVIDERFSPKSLTKGIEYLKKNYDIFKDEILMLVAYNWGPSNTKEITDKYGTEWKNIKWHIPKETRNYVIRVFSRKRLLDNGDVKFEKKTLFSNSFEEYVLKEGEYIYKIAMNLGIDPKLLVQCNPGVKNPYKLKEGDVIFVPKIS